MDIYIPSWLARVFDTGKLGALERVELTFVAPWIEGNQFWFALVVLGLGLAAVLYYLYLQHRGSRRSRAGLGLARGLLLALLVATLAGPVLRLTQTNQEPPVIYLLLDGTDSMAMEDDWTRDARGDNHRAVGQPAGAESTRLRTRHDYLRALLASESDGALDELTRRTGARLAAFIFDGRTTSHLRRLPDSSGGEVIARRAWAEELTTTGQVTALGVALSEVPKQAGAAHLAAVIVFSDFAHNAGPPPLADQSPSVASELGVPIYTVGLGAVEATDLAVELLTDGTMKKAERTTLVVRWRQSGLTGQPVNFRVTAHRRDGPASPDESADFDLAQRPLVLDAAQGSFEVAFTPHTAGRWEFTVAAEALAAETVTDNNRASRQVQVIDDFLRLLYVAYEPEWEWRFIKEVFQRDPLVGVDGFRTYLASSDPRVRQTNPLFVDGLTSARSEFFAHDVIFLGDVPATALTERFCENVREYVGRHGGGLVVLAGPRFGVRELASTSLADMLPVVVDPDQPIRDERPFAFSRTAAAEPYSFMRLADEPAADAQAWGNLGIVPWYQPVAALHEQAVVLAQHPTDKCHDGQTPQPLVAIRRFGQGEVVYLAFNEMWRLRRKFGEQYYRRYWSQLIYRLGMSHALGDAKRFVLRVDRQVYRVEDEVALTVEAYDANYEPLAADQGVGALPGELIPPGRDGQPRQPVPLPVPMVRSGFFETRFPVYEPGEYVVRVPDPVSRRVEERRFHVEDSSAERRRPTRDLALQRELASRTGGRAYELGELDQLAGDVRASPFPVRVTRDVVLWSTPAWFVLVVGLMVGEWIVRRWLDLP